MQSREEARLIKKYLAGDIRASRIIEEIVDIGLNSWRGRLGLFVHDARSDILYKLYQIFLKGEFEHRSGIKTYISRIVQNTCIDYFRKARKFVDTPPEDLELPSKLFNPEKDYRKKELAKFLFRLLRRLPRECISLWRMRLQDNLSCREIAEKMKISEENVRWKLWSCREKAKEIREKMYPEL